MNDNYFNQVVTAFKLISKIVLFDGKSKYPINFYFAQKGNRSPSPLSNGWVTNAARLPITFGGKSNPHRFGNSSTNQLVQRVIAPSPSNGAPSHGHNSSGLPDQLKRGIESLSGIEMNDVKVHYNSDKPAQLQAHAYAQGQEIHLAPGQEKHLPHEAWHVVQQKQGRVKPTLQMKSKVSPNVAAPAQLNAHAYAQGSNIHLAAGQEKHLPHEAWHVAQQAQGRVKATAQMKHNGQPPAQLNAHAYAHGSQIHIAPGQEKHLPHEAWHVVQQKQAQLKATVQRKGGVPVNDDVGLESEADVMGDKASRIQLKSIRGISINDEPRLEQEADLLGARALAIGNNAGRSPTVMNRPNPLAQQLLAAIHRVPENRHLQRAMQLGSKVLVDRHSTPSIETPNASMILLELALELHWNASLEIARQSNNRSPVLDVCIQWLCKDAAKKGDASKTAFAISKEELIEYLKEPCGYMVLYVCLQRA